MTYHIQHDNSLSIIVFLRLVLVIIISRPTVTFIDVGHGCCDTQFGVHIVDTVYPTSLSFNLQLMLLSLNQSARNTHRTSYISNRARLRFLDMPWSSLSEHFDNSFEI